MCTVADRSSFSRSEIFRFWSFRISSLGSIFLVGRFEIWEALAAYYNVDKFSSKKRSAGERHAIIRVYEFPPRDCFKSEVSFDSR